MKVMIHDYSPGIVPLRFVPEPKFDDLSAFASYVFRDRGGQESASILRSNSWTPALRLVG